MKRFLTSITFALLFTACGKSTVVFTLGIATEDAGRRLELVAATDRVVERKLASMGESEYIVDISRKGDDTILEVEVADNAIGDVLINNLTDPFNLRIMTEADAEEAELTVEGHGGFKQSGITEEHLEWLLAEEEERGTGRITIQFTEEGRDFMATIFAANKGKNIGIFVKDQLVSKLLVDTDELRDEIVITEIPSVDLARVFADDVNVGMYVTFTPAQ